VNGAFSCGSLANGTTIPCTDYGGLKFSQGSYFWNVFTKGADGTLFFTPSGLTSYGWIDRATCNFHGSSDLRIKKDITALGTVLDRALKLRPVAYRNKSQNASEPKSIGFIAQELEPLFPEVVSESGDMKGVAYTALIPVAFGAIQELHEKIEAKSQQ